MIKIISSIAIIAMMFSGCVGTLVDNDKATKFNHNIAKGQHNKVETQDIKREPQNR